MIPFNAPETPATTLPAVFAPREQRTATVNHEADGRFFVIEFRYFPGTVAIPATYPAGAPHYPATVTVFEVVGGAKVPVCEPFGGIYTEGKCYEDRPGDIVAGALKEASK